MSKRHKFSIIIILFIVLLSSVVFLISANITDQMENTVTTRAGEEVKIEDLIITETREGKKYWEIYARSGKYSDVIEKFLLTDIVGNFYEDGKVTMSFESPIGTYKEKTKEITLSGGSKIATEDDIFVSAEEISWVGSKDKIVAHGNVKIIKSNELVTISDSSEFDTGFTKLKIEGNSKTILYENQRK